MQLNTSSGYHIQPIGHINSCYKQCIGTPRQGLLVPSSRSSIVLIKQMSPECLDGLEEFSHVNCFRLDFINRIYLYLN